MKYIAIDIGKKNCVVCIMDSDGTIIDETTYPNTLADAESFAKQMIQQYGHCTAVCESTGNLWIKTCQAFERNGIPVQLANPVKTRAIAEAKIKTDTVDARTLAHLLRSNLVARCYIASADIRDSRTLLRHRTNLVHDRTQVMNRIHSLLDKYDLSFERCKNIFGVYGMKWLNQQHLASNNDDVMLYQCIRHIEFLNQEIKYIESKIAQDAINNEHVTILMSMTGINYFGAMMISSEIGDVSRFSTPKKMISWAGLCPSIHQSGNSLYHGKMKEGNRKIKWMMIQAAISAARTDDRLRSVYSRVAKRHGHHIAITHVANKMMTIIWHMLTNNVLYNQRNHNLYDAKLKRMHKIA